MEKKTSKHCGNKFSGMNEYSNVQINSDEVRDVVKKLERQLKSGRVFFPEDAPFGMKCETLLKNAASGIADLSVSGMSFTAKDMTTYAEGDQPKEVTVNKEDFIALLDNTKKGLFGSEFVAHLAYIARGKGSEFDCDEIRPEGAGDADESERASDADE